MLEKFLTKDNVIIVIVAVAMAIGFIYNCNYFATKCQLLELRNELLQQKVELMKYSDQQDSKIMDQLDAKYEKILHKLDQLQKR